MLMIEPLPWAIMMGMTSRQPNMAEATLSVMISFKSLKVMFASDRTEP
jgi:hypothetical protein